MKTDLSLPLNLSSASHEIARKASQAAPPTMPPLAGAHASMSGAEPSVPNQDFDIRADLALFARVLRRVKGAKLVLAIFSAWTLATVASMVGQVRLNKWHGQFFDSITRKDLPDFIHYIWLFLPLVAVMLALTVTQAFLQERLKFRVREWVSRHLLNEWLKPMRIYQLSFAGDDGRNPDQRIQEDTRIIGDSSADLTCGATNSVLQIIAFVGVLWGLSTQVTFDVGGHHIAIPGYMVWCALIYALVGSTLTWLVGRPLISLNGERYAREAEFRFALVRVNESGESIALHGGEKDEQKNLEGALAAVVDTMRRISTCLAHLTWVTSGTGWLSIIVPMLVASPAYFAGNLTMGNLIMVAGAFNQVQGAMRWFVDNFSRLADWRAAIHRVARFRSALDDMPVVEEGSEKIERALNLDGHFAFEGVRIRRPDGQSIIEDASAAVKPGDRVLIIGETGAGKSTLFRAIAGLWPWGSGTIKTPPLENMAFLPQRPYLPLGTLRYALTYPMPSDTFDDIVVRNALKRVDLEELIPALDRKARWDKDLSLGEQQRLAFARLLLHKPAWVFLDEATAALDQASQHRVMSLFDEELKGTTLLSIGHRPDLAAYHTRTLQLIHDADGDRLRIKPRAATPERPRWRRRFVNWRQLGKRRRSIYNAQ
jgi:putative ATP-binding cassette transporter